MAERYYRAQLLLDPEQHQSLREIARREARSISAVAREVIDLGLEALGQDQRARAERRAKALARLAQIREGIFAEHGVFEGDLVAEARAEREQGLEEARREAP